MNSLSTAAGRDELRRSMAAELAAKMPENPCIGQTKAFWLTPDGFFRLLDLADAGERHYQSIVAEVSRHMEGTKGDYALGWQNACHTILCRIAEPPPPARAAAEETKHE
jgi:hypothetical protein